jgi:pyruvate, water dikinase
MTANSHTDFIGTSTGTKMIEHSGLPGMKTKVMMTLDNPQLAADYSFLPNDGVGLISLDFIITRNIRAHPLALKHYHALADTNTAKQIEQLTHPYLNKEDYFILNLAVSIAAVAAAFHPKDVFVQMSRLTTVEWRNMIGGNQFERIESNPMIGLRGAARYLNPQFRAAFEMECEAIKLVREEMGFANVKLVVPFCRTSREADRVVKLMANHGLLRGDKGLEIFITVETPCNAMMASRFAKHVDGFLICPLNLSKLLLGAEDNLQEVVAMGADPVSQLIRRSVHEAKREGIHRQYNLLSERHC